MHDYDTSGIPYNTPPVGDAPISEMNARILVLEARIAALEAEFWRRSNPVDTTPVLICRGEDREAAERILRDTPPVIICNENDREAAESILKATNEVRSWG